MTPTVLPTPTNHAIDDAAACTTNVLPRNDDGSTERVDLPFGVNFFGNTYNSLYVNNNGNVTFDAPLSTYTPFGLTTNISTPIIAPFFADVDTTNPNSGQVTYGASADGKTFCANWAGVGVGYYSGHNDKLVWAQLKLVDTSGDPGGVPGDFDIVMNYDGVGWETGDASGGSGGMGGSSARAGYSAGTGAAGTFFEFPGSGVPGSFLDTSDSGLIHGDRDSTQLGRYVFRVRSGAVPVGHSVSGTVYAGSAAAGHELADAFVQVCPATVTDRGCNTSSTNALGQYQVAGLPAGPYVVQATPPGSSNAGPAQHSLDLTVNADLTGQDVVLQVPTPLPAGTTLTDLYVDRAGLPVVYWGEPLTLETHGCAGAVASYLLTQNDQTMRSGTLTEGADGDYSTVIAPLNPVHGYARITITLACPAGSPNVIAFDLYIDPSGTVVDTAGHPVQGATVTLLRSDDVAGPFVVVPDGSGLMSVANRQNPATTTANGHFGWDVVAGYYRVQATRPGCVSASDPAQPYGQTGTLTIPPPATGLSIVLSCTDRPPTAPDLTVTTDENTPVTVNVLAGVGDPDGDAVTFASATSATHGDVSCTAAGSCTYLPNLDATGPDAFSYTVSDGRGGTATGTVQVSITPVNHPPTAAFTASASSGNAPLTVRFDASSSIDAEGIANYGWAFGDGTTDTGKVVSHTFTASGSYHPVLTVTDTSGATDTADTTIVVGAGPIPPTGPRDSLSMSRTGPISYQYGGMLDSGDFTVGYKGTAIHSITGTGMVSGKSTTFNVTVNKGRVHGKIVVRNVNGVVVGKVVDRIEARGSALTVLGNTITATLVWGADPAHLNALTWSITDAHP